MAFEQLKVMTLYRRTYKKEGNIKLSSWDFMPPNPEKCLKIERADFDIPEGYTVMRLAIGPIIKNADGGICQLGRGLSGAPMIVDGGKTIDLPVPEKIDLLPCKGK